LPQLKDLIRQRRTEIGKTLEQIGIEMGVSKATVQRWESGEIKDIRRSKMVALAKSLETTPAYLMGWDSEKSEAGLSEFPEKHWSAPLVMAYASAITPKQEATCAVLGIPHVIPDMDDVPNIPTCEMLVYAFPAAAGIPLLAEDDYDRIEFPESVVPSGADFGIRIKGDSMQPTIEDGSIVFVRKQPDLQNGQIGIFMIDGEAACKRYFHKGTTVTLRSENPEYADIEIKPYQEFYIAGRVLGYH